MNENEEEIFIPTLVLNFVIIIITFYLLFLYMKSQAFYTYTCAHILNLSLILSIDNIVRIILIPNAWNHFLILQYFQAFILVSLDKFILLVLTGQVFTIYVGVMKTDFYFEHEKAIFLTTFLGSLCLSLLLGGFYLLFGIVKYGVYYYAQGNETKTVLDSIFNSVFLVLDTFYCVVIIYNMIRNIEKVKESMIDKDYEHHLIKLVLMFFSNTLLFVESFLILYDKLPVPDNCIDLVYLTTCLIINMIYSINQKVLNESRNLCCKNSHNSKKHRKLNTFQSSGNHHNSSEEM